MKEKLSAEGFWENFIKTGTCIVCSHDFAPEKTQFITLYAPKKPAVDFCSVACLTEYQGRRKIVIQEATESW